MTRLAAKIAIFRRYVALHVELCCRAADVSPDLWPSDYRTARSSSRANLLEQARLLRDLWYLAGAPRPVLRERVEVRTAADFVTLVLNDRIPLDRVAEVLHRLEEGDDGVMVVEAASWPRGR